MKQLKKILLWFLICLALLFITSWVLIYAKQEQIVKYFIKEANKHLKTSVQVDEVELSLFKKFPQISIHCKNIKMSESYENSNKSLVEAQNLYLIFNLWDIFKGTYDIKQIDLEDAQVFMKINKYGENNFQIIKPDSTKSSNTNFTFNLNKIRLKKVYFNYTDEQINQEISLYTSNLSSNMTIKSLQYNFKINGGIEVKDIFVNDTHWLENRLFKVKGDLEVDDEKDQLNITDAQITHRDFQYDVAGNYSWDTSQIDININSKQTSIESILALLPQTVYHSLKDYESTGEAYFSGKINGKISKEVLPNISLNFGCENATFFHPQYKKELKNINFEGSFSSGNNKNFEQASLRINQFQAILDEEKINADVTIKNFKDPYAKCRFKTKLKLQSLLSFYPIPSILEAQGNIDFNIAFEGNINDLKKSNTAFKTKTSGEINFDNVGFLWKDYKLPFKNFNANFIFTKNELAISNFSGHIGRSDFKLNGFIKNIIAFLLFKNESIVIESDLTSNFMDIQEILSGSSEPLRGALETPTPPSKNQYQFTISPHISLIFDCDIKNIQFKRFQGTNFQGQLNVKDQVARIRKAQINTTDGSITLESIIDARVPQKIPISIKTEFKHLAINKIFYTFENFNQDFLTDTHLKGNLDAQASLYMEFNNHLQFLNDPFKATINATVKDGELNNFEPLHYLSDFVDEKALANIKFSQMSNEIVIKDNTIYLPKMKINSNITDLEVSGSHTFDQHIDYRIKLPLRNFKSKDKDEAFGAIKPENYGLIKLYLKITGTTDDYAISYDRKAALKGFTESIKKEKQTLKDIFKNKGQDTHKTKELEEEEYFDFE